MNNSAQNPKLAHVEKLIETLAGKVRQTLDDQARIAHNPETALQAAEKISAQLQEAYEVAFSKNAPILGEGIDENTGWHITAVSSVRNLARSLAPMASIFTYVKEGNAVFSAIWQPSLLSFSYATKGMGAFTQDIGRLRSSTLEELSSDVVVSLPWATADAEKPLSTASEAGFHTRKTGCMASDILSLCAGRTDIAVATQLTPAAQGALELFAFEAGGKVTAKDGVTVASNRALHAEATQTFLA